MKRFKVERRIEIEGLTWSIEIISKFLFISIIQSLEVLDFSFAKFSILQVTDIGILNEEKSQKKSGQWMQEKDAIYQI